MFDKPEKFEHDAEVWRDQAEGFAKAAEAAAAIAKDTATAASEAVWKGPMPTERLTRMQEQALDAANSADVLATMRRPAAPSPMRPKTRRRPSTSSAASGTTATSSNGSAATVTTTTSAASSTRRPRPPGPC